MSTRTAAWLAWSIWALALALSPITLLLKFVNDSAAFSSNVFQRLVLLVFATVGALVNSRRPANPIGWLFCAAALLWAAGGLALDYAVYTLVTQPGALPGGAGLAWFGAWAETFGWFLMLTFLLLPTIVETVAQALKLPYVAIALATTGDRRPTTDQQGSPQGPPADDTAAPVGSFTIVAAYGAPTVDPMQLPLTYQAEPVGQLILGPRAGETFGPADRRLLDDLARQAGVAVHAVWLTAELQRAREHLVSAREEERWRLRRDLHDGLGPQLASQTLTLTAARKLLRHDPETAEVLLTDAMAHAQAAITDIRCLVYALRPPALDDLELVAALREQAAQYDASGMQITFDAPERLPPLPAAVEVACYRITQEALANVVRHAAAGTCVVTLTVSDALELAIRDDGSGLSADHRAGVGLISMRERAVELGGTCVIAPARDGGTCVRARLPLANDAVHAACDGERNADGLHPHPDRRRSPGLPLWAARAPKRGAGA